MSQQRLKQWEALRDGTGSVTTPEGDHSIKTTRLAFSLAHLAREAFPINEVPAEIVIKLKEITKAALETESRARELADLMIVEIEKTIPPPPPVDPATDSSHRPESRKWPGTAPR